MIVHRLNFHHMPSVRFAHRYGTDNYNANFPLRSQTVEISYIVRGGLHLETEQGTDFAPVNSVLITVYNKKQHFYCTEDYHQHTTVGLTVDYEEVSEGGLILPMVLSLKKHENPVRPMMEKLVLQYNLAPENPRVTAMLFELLGMISDIYQSELQEEVTFGKEWYVNRAKQYIIENIEKPPHIMDTAKFLDISPGYLSHIFSELTGQTLTGFINLIRVRRIEELVLSYGMDIKEAGEQVGLMDPNYVSRLFKQVRGCTLSEIRHAKYKEIGS